MGKLTVESAEKLQKILTKRLGRELTEQELEVAYENLLGFAMALAELRPTIPLIYFNQHIKELTIIFYRETIADYLYFSV